MSVALRCAAALAMGNSVAPLPGSFDQVSYDALAQRVAAGQGFRFAQESWPGTPAGQPTAFWSFLYTGFLAGVYGLLGHQPLVARLLQAVLAGLLLPLGLFLLGRQLFGERAGLWSALLGALNLYFVYYTAALMTESFTLVAEVWLLVVVLLLAERPSWARWAACGAIVGLGALLRQVTLVVVPFLWGWLAFQLRDRRALAGLALASAVALAFVLPVTARNYRVYGRLVPVNTNNGFALYLSNHPAHGTSYRGGLEDEAPDYTAMIPAELRGLDEAAQNDRLQALALAEIARDPARFLRLSLSRLEDYFIFWPSPASSPASNLVRVLSYGLLLPLILAGLWLTRADWRRCLPIYLFALVYAGVHLVSWASVRYRLPVDAALLPFAAVALEAIASRLPGWRPAASATRSEA